MKMKLLLAALAAVVCASAVPTMAGDPKLPADAYRVKRATIGPMIDPPGSFAVTYWGKDVAGQCPINPAWTVTVTLRPDIDGTYIRSVCPRTGPTPCECDIFVRTDDAKRAWELALARYRSDYRYTLPVDPPAEARIVTGNITYSAGGRTVNLAVGAGVLDLVRGERFRLSLDASVPADAPSPCPDPEGRSCYLTLELWRTAPNGSREMMSQVESLDLGKRRLESGTTATVSVEGIIPGVGSFRRLPTGEYILVARWFLMKNFASREDYKISVGGFEVPVNIR